MKWFIIVLLLFVIGCSTAESCDQLFEKKYPAKTYLVSQANNARMYTFYNSNKAFYCFVGVPDFKIRELKQREQKSIVEKE